MSKNKFLYFLIFLFILTRFINLTLLPIFSDEANYIEWGMRAIHAPTTAFHSLQDGKQPGLIWLFGALAYIFPDPLGAARFVSVLFGLSNLTALYLISKKIFGQKTAHISSILYLTSPLFTFYDRQALMESSLIAVSLWSLFFYRKLIDAPKIKYAIIIGAILGLGFFIKSTALIFIICYFFLLLARRKLIYFNLGLVSAITLLLVVSPMLFQSIFWSTLYRNSQYVAFSWEGWLKTFPANLEVLFIYLTPPIFISIMLGFKKTPKTILLWALIPFCLYLLSVRNANALLQRYSTPFLPLFLMPAANYLSQHKKILILTIATCTLYLIPLLFSPPLYFSVLSKITKYSYSSDYVTGFDTGYQVNAVRTFFSDKQNIIIATKVAAFNPEAGLITYYRRSPHVQITFLDSQLLGPEISNYDCLSTGRTTYFVAKLNDTAGLERFLVNPVKITNSHNSDYSTIYTLKSNCPPSKTAELILTSN